MEAQIVPVKWAQRKDIVILTLEAIDLSEENRVIEVKPEGSLRFEGKNKQTGQNYKVELEFFDEVNPDESKWKVTDLHVQLTVSKKNKEAEYWPRLTKEKAKVPWISVDWNKWVDEDEEEEKDDFNFGDFEDLPDSDDEDEEEAPADLDDLEGPPEGVEESKA